MGDAGRVMAVGPYAALRDHVRADIADLGDVVLAPALLNAPTHLGVSQVPATELTWEQGFVAWVESLVPRLTEPLPEQTLQTILTAMAEAGTGFVADVVSRFCGPITRHLFASPLGFILFLEAFGFDADPDDFWPQPCAAQLPPSGWERVAAAGHALYSTHPDTLRAAKQWSTARGRPFSLHLAEDAGERELTLSGGGGLADFYRRAGVLPVDYRAPGISPTAYAHALGLLDIRSLAVHCVHVDADDIQLLRRSGASVALCPRSNVIIGVGRAPAEELLTSGINVCLATDGLCSTPDLDLWNELFFFKQNLKCVLRPVDLLRLVTANPARALGLEADMGVVRPGARAIFSRVPRWLVNFNPSQNPLGE